jgi:hypothetical protein
MRNVSVAQLSPKQMSQSILLDKVRHNFKPAPPTKGFRSKVIMKSTGMTARSAGTSACQDNISQIKDLKQNQSHAEC